jgi:hypothetical protein
LTGSRKSERISGRKEDEATYDSIKTHFGYPYRAGERTNGKRVCFRKKQLVHGARTVVPMHRPVSANQYYSFLFIKEGDHE